MKILSKKHLSQIFAGALVLSCVITMPTAAALTIGETSISSPGGLSITGDIDLTGSIDVSGNVLVDGNILLPPGSIIMYSANVAPDGYLLCNGAAVSRTTYSDLYAVVGTTYGVGDGATTFNLPNFSNRMPFMSGDVGTTGGSTTVTLTTNELPSHTHTGTTDADGSHTHTINDPGHSHAILNARDDGNISNNPGQASPGDANENYTNGYGTQSATTGISINAGGNHTHDFTTNATGSGNAFSIMNPYLTTKFIIKY